MIHLVPIVCIWTKNVIWTGEGRNIHIVVCLHHKLLLSEVLSKYLIFYLLIVFWIFNINCTLLVSLWKLIQVDMSSVQETVGVTIWCFLVTQIEATHFLIRITTSMDWCKSIANNLSIKSLKIVLPLIINNGMFILIDDFFCQFLILMRDSREAI